METLYTIGVQHNRMSPPKRNSLSWLLEQAHLLGLVRKLLDTPIPFGVRYNGHVLYGWKFNKKLYGHEPETVQFFKRNVRPGDRVADVGAAVGFYTMLFSDLVGDSGMVYAFEPDDLSFTRLQRAVRKSRRKNITLIHAAVGAEKGQAPLYGERGSGKNSLNFKWGAVVKTVPIIRLSDYPIAWAKIDVEGYELEVLKGLDDTVPVTVEFSHKNLAGAGITPEQFIRSIQDRGYVVNTINSDGTTTMISSAADLKSVRGHINLFLDA